MTELENLNAKLADMAQPTAFRLDERTAKTLLTQWQNYTQAIPFNDENDDQRFWQTFWFLHSQTPASLARYYQTLTRADGKLSPHQGWLLAFLRLLETPKALLNSIPARHRALYYNDLLGLYPHSATPDQLALKFQLASNATDYLLPAGTLFSAAQDSQGTARNYALDETIQLTAQQLSQLSWTRQNDDEWLLCLAQDEAQQITLPEAGIRLFSATENETPLREESLLTLSGLPAIPGPLQVALTFTDTLPSGAISVDDLNADTLTGQPLTPGAATGDYTFILKDGVPTSALRLHSALGNLLPAPQQVSLSYRDNTAFTLTTPDAKTSPASFSYPFGTSPRQGSFFELSLPAWLSDYGGTLTLTPRWRDLPAVSFSEWYKNYATPPTNADFTVQASLVFSDKTENTGNPLPLFSAAGAPQGTTLTVTLPSTPAGQARPSALRIALNHKDFQHSAYATDATGKNPPWTPQVSRIDLACQLTLADKDYCFQHHSPLPRQQGDNPAPERALNLGFSQAAPGETLSLWWSLNTPTPLPLNWYYYSSQQRWRSLEGYIRDRTQNLATSGLWQVELPADITVGAPGREAGLTWLVATLPEETDDETAKNTTDALMPKLQAIWANAMTATLDNAMVIADDHYRHPLPAGTVTRPETAISAIRSVSQPLASWGGKPTEDLTAFYARATNRIANRHRAVSWGDMRTLLIENYPQLLDVKTPSADRLTRIPAPVKQQLVIIPDNGYLDNDDPLRPQLSSGRLKQMEQWLSGLGSPWVTPEIINPVYVDVEASYQVRFRGGISAAYGYQQLTQLLEAKFMPWSADIRQRVTPGNQIDYFQLLATLQSAPLVERVQNLTLRRRDAGHIANTQQTLIAADNEVLILRSVISQEGE